jgi:hypothetical protein
MGTVSFVCSGRHFPKADLAYALLAERSYWCPLVTIDRNCCNPACNSLISLFEKLIVLGELLAG